MSIIASASKFAGVTPSGVTTLSGPTGPSGTLSKAAAALSAVRVLPEHISLEGLVAWLGARMRQTDDAIRAKMKSMHGAKERQAEIQGVLSSLNAAKTTDLGHGRVEAPAPLDDPEKFRASELYRTADDKTREAFDAFLASVEPRGFLVNADVTVGSVTYKKGSVIPPEVANSIPVPDGTFTELPPRIHKDHLESVTKSLSEALNASNATNEIEMIELQTQISARSQIIQLVSNMIASFNDSAKSVIGNSRV